MIVNERSLFMKKILCIVLSVVLLLSVNITAFAEENVIPSTEISNESDYTPSAMYDDYLNAFARSTSVPRNYYDLSTGRYHANLELVNVSWLYTNYYFYANSAGKLKVTYTIYSDTGRPTEMKVGLYDLETRRIVTTWTSSGSTLSGITESFNFINLDSSHRYAVAFQAVFDGWSHDSLHGSAIISH